MSDKQPKALRLADDLPALFENDVLDASDVADAAAELRRLHALCDEMGEALKVSVTQNSHDMVMTGEELRVCESTLAKWKESK